MVHEKNPICLTLCYELGDKDNSLVIENKDLSFTIVYNIFTRYGGDHCIKEWIHPDAKFVCAWIDIQTENGLIYSV